MGGKHDIYIIEVAGEFRVRPAVAMVDGSTKKLNIRNLTGYAATLVFPLGFLAGDQEVFSIASMDKKPADLMQNLDGQFQYLVVINKNGELVPAKGESAPSVIVDL